jgi:hypothetical protein
VRQNRVTPYGELVAVPDRGMFWGNRGVLVDRQGRLARYSRGLTWAICVLEYKGRRRQQWSPGRLTELFFLDEATGLAWTPGGYLDRHAGVPASPVTVITPRATVATLAAGYRPVFHPTADR